MDVAIESGIRSSELCVYPCIFAYGARAEASAAYLACNITRTHKLGRGKESRGVEFGAASAAV